MIWRLWKYGSLRLLRVHWRVPYCTTIHARARFGDHQWSPMICWSRIPLGCYGWRCWDPRWAGICAGAKIPNSGCIVLNWKIFKYFEKRCLPEGGDPRPGVPLGAHWGAEDDDVLREGGVQHEHCAHRTAWTWGGKSRTQQTVAPKKWNHVGFP